ncbi:hypothetical protein [Shewanella sp. AC34-MNA-CIBAN-0136]
MKRYLQRLIASTVQQSRQTVAGLTFSRLTHATEYSRNTGTKGIQQ